MDSVIVLAVPFFLLLMGLEALWNRRRGGSGYAFADTLSNVGCGVGQQTLGLITRGLSFAGYVWLERQVGLFDLGLDSLAGWAVALVGVDLSYYWFHRSSHRVNLLWANHIVHHQSEELNLSVALRQSWFVTFTEWPFYMPLALLGVPLELLLAAASVNLLFQFAVHTEAIGRLGPLEWVFNTPSHHRVHHAVNPGYLDANYAGILIVWDRLFGTFVPEGEEPVYGTVEPLRSFSPLWANVHRWVELAALSRRATSAGDKLRVWFAPPEWRPAEAGGPVVPPVVRRATRAKHRAPAPAALVAYAAAQMALAVVVTLALIAHHEALGPAATTGLVGLCVAAVVLPCALVEGRAWALPLELLRLCATAGALLVALGELQPVPALAAAATAASLAAWLWRCRAHLGAVRAEATPAPAPEPVA